VSTSVAAVGFFAGAAISLSASWLLVSRIERAGARFHLSEALLGLLSALAADAPEITSAVTALSGHQGAVGAGVVIGSNVFNLAALIGLGAVVARRIPLLRRAVLLQGAIALWIALLCLVLVIRVMPAAAAVGLAAAVMVPYVTIAAASHTRWWHRPHASPMRRWLERAIAEEEIEIGGDPGVPPARRADALVGALSLVVVVVASIVMEHAASSLGRRVHAPGIVVGGIVLAAVTSLPNAVAAIYWAKRGRGTATLSTALNSNALNVTIGFFVPAAIVGIGAGSGGETLVASWYVGLTVLALAVAYVRREVDRVTGWVIVGCYAVFVGTLLAVG